MSQSWTPEKMAERMIRYDDLRPCLNAFVDTYTPGSDKKEKFTVIAPGVAEHSDQHVHLSEPHGFNVRRMDFELCSLLPTHKRDELTLGEGDVLTVPIGLAHSYRNFGETLALAYVVRGGYQPAAETLVAAEPAAQFIDIHHSAACA